MHCFVSKLIYLCVFTINKNNGICRQRSVEIFKNSRLNVSQTAYITIANILFVKKKKQELSITNGSFDITMLLHTRIPYEFEKKNIQT